MYETSIAAPVTATAVLVVAGVSLSEVLGVVLIVTLLVIVGVRYWPRLTRKP